MSCAGIWRRVDVARHKALKVLKDAGAWEEIIVPTFQNVGTEDEEDDGTAIVPDGTKSVFTENLLRNQAPGIFRNGKKGRHLN